MADASEDTIHPASHTTASPNSPTLSDSDPDEGTPDFRFLSSLTSNSTLPRRGIKDFEPQPTNLQATQLDVARQAMHDALSHTRVHAPRSHVLGVYDWRSGLTRVRKPRGAIFKTVGTTEKGGRGSVMLLPEEALWALETARLDVRWGEDEEDDEDEKKETPERVEEDTQEESQQVEEDANEQEEEANDEDEAELKLIPMSLQGAYAAFLGEESERGGSLTLERYLVYAGLKRSGFTVLRAEGWDGRPVPSNPPPPLEDKYAKVGEQTQSQSILSWLFNLFSLNAHTQSTSSKQGPLVKPGFYRTYDEIFRLLHIIPCWQPHLPSSTTTTPSFTSSTPSTTTTQTHLTTHFNVYRPGPHFRKTNPGPPDFRICVVDARNTGMPTLQELSGVMSEQPTPSASASAASRNSKLASPATKQQTQRKPPQPMQNAIQEFEPSPSSLPLSFFIPSSHSTITNNTAKQQDTLPQFYRRLKTGVSTPARNVILAIVDQGVISYVRFTEGVFGSERVWERVVNAAERGAGGGGKGGGGGARGGRGGGRGRGGRGRGRGR